MLCDFAKPDFSNVSAKNIGANCTVNLIIAVLFTLNIIIISYGINMIDIDTRSSIGNYRDCAVHGHLMIPMF